MMQEELEEVTTEEAEATETEEQTTEVVDNRDYDAEAREMGWVPQEEFNGPEGRWKDAKTFVQDGEQILPIVNARLKRTEEQLNSERSEFETRIARMEAMGEKRLAAQQAQFDRELERIKDEQLKAVEDGDTAAFQRLDKERDNITKQASEVLKDDKPDDEKVQADWMTQNPWYRDDFDMHNEATNYSQFMAKNNPNMTLSENLQKVEEHMKGKYPEKFGLETPKPKANGHAAVDGGSAIQTPAFGKKEKGFNDLPAEAKTMCERDIADGLFKDKAEWAKEYFADGA